MRFPVVLASLFAENAAKTAPVGAAVMTTMTNRTEATEEDAKRKNFVCPQGLKTEHLQVFFCSLYLFLVIPCRCGLWHLLSGCKPKRTDMLYRILIAILMLHACAAELVAVESATIAIVREGGLVKISFTGTLEFAPNASGPWSAVPNAVSPYSSDTSAGTKFFRSYSIASIFSTNSVVELKITGPLQEHFELAFAGMPDGIFPPIRQKPYFDGTIQIAGFTRPASLRVRGNSSLQECPFPKMKFKVSREERANTPFFDAREIKIGTHCAEGGRGPIGRLRDQTATYREALAYETMDLLGFISPRVRRARIEYHDTTPTNGTSEVGWEVTRNAVILDDIEVVTERLGGRALDDEEITALTNANFDPQLVLDLQLFHALLGNWDYVLPPDGRGIWNTDVIELTNKTLVPVAGDFDLASWVTGEVRLSVPWDYRPDLPEIDRQALYSIDQLKQRASASEYSNAANRFVLRRSAIESQINSALIDEPGRTNALRHVTAFFGAIEALAQKR